MTVEHHDLVHELPEHRDTIHRLKIENAHFRKLFDRYHDLTREIENMENGAIAVATAIEEAAKFHRLHLKDELNAMLQQHAGATA